VNGQKLSTPSDLDWMFQSAEDVWQELRDVRLFLTGGTGFFGRWLLESLVRANQKFKLNSEILVLSRNPKAFEKLAPHLANNPAISLQAGDVRNFDFPQKKITHIIHAATTTAEETFIGADPLKKFDTIVEGTRRVLDYAVHSKARKFLLTSSGSAYGTQPLDVTHISEEYCGGPITTDRNFEKSALGEGKRAAEMLCTIYQEKYEFEVKIARCFSIVGPGLPLDFHYAIGNFVRDVLKGGPIQVNGDGTPERSYLYITDLIYWLWTILVLGRPGRMYNVGSDQSISIKDLANLVASSSNYKCEVVFGNHSTTNHCNNRYVPSIKRAREELNLDVMTPLKSAIKNSYEYYNKKIYNHSGFA